MIFVGLLWHLCFDEKIFLTGVVEIVWYGSIGER